MNDHGQQQSGLAGSLGMRGLSCVIGLARPVGGGMLCALVYNVYMQLGFRPGPSIMEFVPSNARTVGLALSHISLSSPTPPSFPLTQATWENIFLLYPWGEPAGQHLLLVK